MNKAAFLWMDGCKRLAACTYICIDFFTARPTSYGCYCCTSVPSSSSCLLCRYVAEDRLLFWSPLSRRKHENIDRDLALIKPIWEKNGCLCGRKGLSHSSLKCPNGLLLFPAGRWSNCQVVDPSPGCVRCVHQQYLTTSIAARACLFLSCFVQQSIYNAAA